LDQPSVQSAIQMNYLESYKRFNQRSQMVQETNAPEAVQDLNIAWGNTCRNGEDWFYRNRIRPARSEQAAVSLGPMVPLWLHVPEQPELLVVVRPVQIGQKGVCQGIVLDWSELHALLLREVVDLFPSATFHPVQGEHLLRPDRVMAALPIELDIGPVPFAAIEPGWTPIRISLALAWAAALVALVAVGLGGWMLLDLSERRIRFVSAVTHELRTPMTTLRLYLDMLTGGLVREEKQREEYLQTLHGETDRLNRLVGNVLDFSRLEKQRPQLEMKPQSLQALLGVVKDDWEERCRTAGKELVVENACDPERDLVTDAGLVQQILGNLIDNSCKYSTSAEDPRIWLRAHQEGTRLILEVEDRGPGIPLRERRSIFRPFRRGARADVSAGGVGLGLALVRRWVKLLGGKLILSSARPQGACFRVELPG
jgi:signal transduction histidine kinase